MRSVAAKGCIPWLAVVAVAALSSAEPAQPRVIEIGHDPQLFVDDYVVDNHWGVLHPAEDVTRVFHAPRKDDRNPVIAGDGGYVNVSRDERTGLFRMWYQEFWLQSLEPMRYTYGVAYAESKDGISWELPRIGKYRFKDTLDNNIVLLSPSEGDAECPFLLDLPKEARRGYEYVLLYVTYDRHQRGMHLVGSQDGINWDTASDTWIAHDFTPDTQNSIVWDPRQQKFVCFTRAVNIYDDKNGLRRRVGRLESPALWDQWPVLTENVLIPDERDVRDGYPLFYGMPTRYYAGIYWGFLWPYRPSKDIYTELAFSRDGREFRRLADRPRLIDTGPADAWDDGMVFGSPGWLEVGDEWWVYYSGSDGPHSSNEAKPGIGLARMRKEGFVSLRSPAGGGVVVTRVLNWPGGKLKVNADAGSGELTVKVTGYDRKPIAGFSPDPSLPINVDSTAHEVKWQGSDMKSLAGRPLRLEFLMNNVVDLYGFRAEPTGE